MPRTPTLHLRDIHPDDYAELTRQAAAAGVNVGDWARFLLLSALRTSPLAKPAGDDLPPC